MENDKAEFDSAALGRMIVNLLVDHQPAIKQVVMKIDSLYRGLASNIETIAPQLASAAMFVGSVDWEAARSAAEALPGRSKEAMERALKRGWFFGWDSSLDQIFRLLKQLDEADDEQVDKVFIEYYEGNLDYLASRLCEQHPSRHEVITAAIQAHRAPEMGGFYLSVPVFISQGDGIYAEISGKEMPLGGGRPGGPPTNAARAIMEQLEGHQDLADLVTPLLQLHNGPFLMSSKARESYVTETGQSFTALNRHQIAHGEISDYGSQLNSLKALSFLVFVGTHLPMTLKHLEERLQEAT